MGQQDVALLLAPTDCAVQATTQELTIEIDERYATAKAWEAAVEKRKQATEQIKIGRAHV